MLSPLAEKVEDFKAKHSSNFSPWILPYFYGTSAVLVEYKWCILKCINVKLLLDWDLPSTSSKYGGMLSMYKLHISEAFLDCLLG